MASNFNSFAKSAGAIAALVCSASAWPLTIDGLSPFAPLAPVQATAKEAGDAMEIRLSPAGVLTVSPWPSFLPSQLDAQIVRGGREMHPGGPSDRLSFTHSGRARPWLLLGAHSIRGTPIVGDWHLQQFDGKWYVTDGRRRKLLGEKGAPASAARIRAGGERWCLYLLDAAVPTKRPGIALEQEPRLSWAAVRRKGACQKKQ